MAIGQVGEFPVGSLVRVRERDWVVLPSDDADILCLRPLSGSESEICGIHRLIEGSSLKHAEFSPPKPEQAGDFIAGKLLRNAARLGLRSGAGPFRSLGRYSAVPIRPPKRLCRSTPRSVPYALTTCSGRTSVEYARSTATLVWQGTFPAGSPSLGLDFQFSQGWKCQNDAGF